MIKNLVSFLALWLCATEMCFANLLTIDFANGRPPESVIEITELTGTTVLDFSNGQMNIGMSQIGDGVDLLVPNFEAFWVSFLDEDLTGFPIGSGFTTTMFFGDDYIAVDVVNDNSTKVKVRQNQGGVEKLLNEVVFNRDFAAITSHMVDWAPPDRPLETKDRFIVILTIPGGGTVSVGSLSDIKHDVVAGGRTHVQLENTSAVIDPTLSIGSIQFSSTPNHAPEPSSIVLLGIGMLGILGYKWKPGRVGIAHHKR